MLKKYGLLTTALLLTACSTTPPSNAPSPPAYPHQVSQMKAGDVQMIQQGDRLTLIIPTDAYFEAGTTTVKGQRQNELKQIAAFTKNFADTYPRSVIRVTGYTDRVFSHRTQLELSQNYAEAVSAYIFNAGVDPRRLATQGRGSLEPIAGEYEPSSMALNRRVVIRVN